MRRTLKKIICLFRKHELKDEPEFRVYIRNGRRFVSQGRIFCCKRCGGTVYILGILDRELAALINTTLKDLPKDCLKDWWK